MLGKGHLPTHRWEYGGDQTRDEQDRPQVPHCVFMPHSPNPHVEPLTPNGMVLGGSLWEGLSHEGGSLQEWGPCLQERGSRDTPGPCQDHLWKESICPKPLR